MAEKEAVKEETTTAPAEETLASAQKRKKVSKMTLEEIDKELKLVQEKMGNLCSDFARHLLAQRDALKTAK